MPNTIPLTGLVLYKHGIATFTRQGAVEGTELELPFRAGEVDDALKSMVVQTLDGGQVAAVSYPTPENKAERFAEIPIELGNQHSLFDLLRSLRGVPVRLILDGGTIEGRLVGVEEHPQGRPGAATVVLLTGADEVEQIATERILRMELRDERMADALGRYLDTSAAEEAHRTVRVALTEPGRRVRVMYTAPSPVWRVSYRLVGELDGGERRALLQGWAIFDNRLDEDLHDVEVALVAGQPVSFRYDLTSSVIPQRTMVRDEARVAAGPVEFEGVMAALPAPGAGEHYEAAAQHDVPAGVRRMALGSRPVRPQEAARHLPQTVMDATLHTTAGREMEELFEYRVGGVSVRRGESAMVSIAQHVGPYRRELLYNGAKHPQHPVAVFRMRNETGLTLERGPITVIEDGQYRGEAMLPFTKADTEILLAYAVELGVTVREAYTDWHSISAVHLVGAYLHIQQYWDHGTTYTLTNATAEGQVVTVERPRSAGAELTATRAPDETTAEHYRWQVPCPPRADGLFHVTERTLMELHHALLDENFDTLAQYLEDHFLDDDARAVLQRILRLRQAMQDAEERIEELRAEREEIGERQDRLRKNLTINAASETEGEIRRRSAEEFRRTQDREAEIEAEIDRLNEERERADAQLHEVLAALES